MNILNTNRKQLILFFLIFTLFSLVACGSSYTKDQSNTEVASPDIDPGFNQNSGVGMDEESAQNVDDHLPIGDAENPAASRKLIKTGEADIKTDDVIKSYESIGKLVLQYKGFETNLNKNESDGHIYITVDYSIPAKDLDTFVADLTEAEDVKYINIETQDITTSYFDSEIRLESLERSLEEYYKLLEDANRMEDIISIQSQIDSITLEIESIKGQMKLWDSQIDYSTLTISITENSDVVNTNREIKFSALNWESFKYYVSNGIVRVLSAIVSIFQYLIIGLIIALPVLIPLALIIFLILRISKKKRAKREQKANMVLPTKQVTNTKHQETNTVNPEQHSR